MRWSGVSSGLLAAFAASMAEATACWVLVVHFEGSSAMLPGYRPVSILLRVVSSFLQKSDQPGATAPAAGAGVEARRPAATR